jgi:hypothetical protein
MWWGNLSRPWVIRLHQKRHDPLRKQVPGDLDDFLVVPGGKDPDLPINPVEPIGPAGGLLFYLADARPRDGNGVGRRFQQLSYERHGMFGIERFQGRGGGTGGDSQSFLKGAEDSNGCPIFRS